MNEPKIPSKDDTKKPPQSEPPPPRPRLPPIEQPTPGTVTEWRVPKPEFEIIE